HRLRGAARRRRGGRARCRLRRRGRADRAAPCRDRPHDLRARRGPGGALGPGAQARRIHDDGRSGAGMMLHLLKLCVGAVSIEDLSAWQAGRIEERRAAGLDPRPRHVTRMWPRRAAEILEGGSLYWVIQGWITVRQGIEGFDEVRREDGIRRCGIVLSPELVPVSPRPRAAFQGWRYLAAGDAPPDARAGFAEAGDPFLPADLARALDGLGV